MFDPGCFYGHHEFDLAIGSLFGMSPGFACAYHDIIPRESGFKTRQQLYQLYNLINHW